MCRGALRSVSSCLICNSSSRCKSCRRLSSAFSSSYSRSVWSQDSQFSSGLERFTTVECKRFNPSISEPRLRPTAYRENSRQLLYVNNLAQNQWSYKLKIFPLKPHQIWQRIFKSYKGKESKQLFRLKGGIPLCLLRLSLYH